MDYYKKKNLKFNSEVGREIRHAETVRARESSRFKRLSMLRCIEDVEQPSFEKTEEKPCQEVKKPVSRLEILRKWKHEKLVKKQLEQKQSIRPFYAGVSSLSSNKGTSKVGKGNQSSGDTSSISKKVPSYNSNLASRVPSTTKQVSSSISYQTSRIPNSSKQVSCNSLPTSRIPNTSKQFGAIPKTTKPQLPRIPSSNQEHAKKPTVFGSNLKTNQVPLKSKIQTGISSSASSLNGSGSSKGLQSRIAKPVSVVPRRIPVQSKLPAASNSKPINVPNKKLPSVPSVGVKLPAVSSNQKSNPGLVKKPGLVSKVELKKAPTISGNLKQGKKAFPASTANTRKGPPEIKIILPDEKNAQPTCSADCKPESDSDGNIESCPDIFDCDVSIIAPQRAPSFAPENFMFQPPSEILDFSFDTSILKKIKEFTSRTSTPTKQNVQGIKSDEEDKEKIQKPSENVAIRTQMSSPLKQPAQISEKDKDAKEIIHTPSEDLYDETNLSTLSKQHSKIHICDKDKKTESEPSEGVAIEDKETEPFEDVYTEPSEGVDIEDKETEPSEGVNIEDKETEPSEGVDIEDKETEPSEGVNIEDKKTEPSEGVNIEDKETVPSEGVDIEDKETEPSEGVDIEDKEIEPSEGVNIEDNIITSKSGQDCKSDEGDNQVMQRSSENIKIEITNSSPTEDLVQCSEKSPLKINPQNSSDSSQSVCHNSIATDEEVLDREKVVAETVEHIDPLLSGGEDREKHKESIPLNVFQNTFQKRRSILKKSTLNSIAEADDVLSQSPVQDAAENKENVLHMTLQRSRRVSNLISIDESPSTTPRRSCRISNLISLDESPSTTPRRSLRLQKKVSNNGQLDDSNPKGSSHTNLTNDFDRLTLEDFDKMNPEDYLCVFDDSPEKMKSKKISLLYSPDKRKSIRRSIRGDLMSFSPNTSPRV